MIKGIGTDIVDLKRLDVSNQKLIRHILSDEEYACFMNLSSEKRKREYLGGRWAGKEAYLKAHAKGLGGIPFHEIIILNHDDGSPYLNDPHAFISLSHETDYAIAFVVVEG